MASSLRGAPAIEVLERFLVVSGYVLNLASFKLSFMKQCSMIWNMQRAPTLPFWVECQ